MAEETPEEKKLREELAREAAKTKPKDALPAIRGKIKAREEKSKKLGGKKAGGKK